jgi:hypothetical protein
MKAICSPIAAYLENPSKTATSRQAAVEEAIATTSTASHLRVGTPAHLQSIDTILYLLVDNAGAEICEAAGTTIAEAIEEAVGPFTPAARVVLRTTGDVGIHARLWSRLGLVNRWTLFTEHSLEFQSRVR